jgi:hypothetical protein
MRWVKVLTLLLGGLLLLGLLAWSVIAGFVRPVMFAFFNGVLGAGAAYYLSFIMPDRITAGAWAGVLGLFGAAAGVAIGGGFAPDSLIAGVLLAAIAVWGGRRVEVTASPDTVEELSSGGYIPFGVGLALAAGLLAYTGGPERMRHMFADLALALGLA